MRVKAWILTALFAALTAIGAYIRIPTGIGTITMQFFFTALAGLLLGAKYGALSQLLYLLLGFAGLPVFAMGGGLGYLLQPACGFVLALPLAAWCIGTFGARAGKLWQLACACAAGLFALYLIGVPYPALLAALASEPAPQILALLRTMMLLYLPADLFKIALCVLLCRRLLPLLRRQPIA